LEIEVDAATPREAAKRAPSRWEANCPEPAQIEVAEIRPHAVSQYGRSEPYEVYPGDDDGAIRGPHLR